MRSRTVTVKTIDFELPPKWLIDQYEAKRDIEIKKKQKEVQKMLHSITDRHGGNTNHKKRMNPNSMKNLKQFKERSIPKHEPIESL